MKKIILILSATTCLESTVLAIPHPISADEIQRALNKRMVVQQARNTKTQSSPYQARLSASPFLSKEGRNSLGNHTSISAGSSTNHDRRYSEPHPHDTSTSVATLSSPRTQYPGTREHPSASQNELFYRMAALNRQGPTTAEPPVAAVPPITQQSNHVSTAAEQQVQAVMGQPPVVAAPSFPPPHPLSRGNSTAAEQQPQAANSPTDSENSADWVILPGDTKAQSASNQWKKALTQEEQMAALEQAADEWEDSDGQMRFSPNETAQRGQSAPAPQPPAPTTGGLWYLMGWLMGGTNAPPQPQPPAATAAPPDAVHQTLNSSNGNQNGRKASSPDFEDIFSGDFKPVDDQPQDPQQGQSSLNSSAFSGMHSLTATELGERKVSPPKSSVSPVSAGGHTAAPRPQGHGHDSAAVAQPTTGGLQVSAGGNAIVAGGNNVVTTASSAEPTTPPAAAAHSPTNDSLNASSSSWVSVRADAPQGGMAQHTPGDSGIPRDSSADGVATGGNDSGQKGNDGPKDAGGDSANSGARDAGGNDSGQKGNEGPTDAGGNSANSGPQGPGGNDSKDAAS